MTGVEEAAVISALASEGAAASAPAVGAALAPELAVGIGGEALAGSLATDALTGSLAADALTGVGAEGLALTEGLLSSAPMAAESASAMPGISAPIMNGYTPAVSGMEGLGSFGNGLSSSQATGITPSLAGSASTNPAYVGVGSQFTPTATQSATQLANGMSFADKARLAMTDPKNVASMGQQGMKMMPQQQGQQGQHAPMMSGGVDGGIPRQTKPFTGFSPYAQMSNFGQGFSASPMKKRMPTSGLL